MPSLEGLLRPSHFREYAKRAPQLSREHGHAAPDLEGSPDASFGIIAIGDRSPEDRHHAIADVLVHSPAVIGNACVGKVEKASEESVNFLGIEFVGELRGAD
jgi:hypothetical protein